MSTTRVSFFPKYSVVNKQEKRGRNQENRRKEKEKEKEEEEEETEEHSRKSRLAGTASTRREKSAETPLAAVNLSLANRVPSRRSGGTAKSTSSSFYYQVRKLWPGIFIVELLQGIVSQQRIICKALRNKIWTVFFHGQIATLKPFSIALLNYFRHYSTYKIRHYPERTSKKPTMTYKFWRISLASSGIWTSRKKSTKTKCLHLNISTVRCSKTRSAQKVSI